MASHLSAGHSSPPAQSVHSAISYLMDLGRQGATRAQGHTAPVLAASQIGKAHLVSNLGLAVGRVLPEAQRLWQRQAHSSQKPERQARHETRSLTRESALPTRHGTASQASTKH